MTIESFAVCLLTGTSMGILGYVLGRWCRPPDHDTHVHLWPNRPGETEIDEATEAAEEPWRESLRDDPPEG